MMPMYSMKWYQHPFQSERGRECLTEKSLQSPEDLLAQKSKVTVPTVTINGTTDPLKPGGTSDHAGMFIGLHEHIITNAGHNVPQEAPQVFADAVLKVHNG